MKYEMIFGDEKLFDGAPEDCFCVAKNVYDDSMFYKEVDRCLFWFDGKTWEPLKFMSRTPIAMRRIIKEPKRWTWEDKKAGRFPEVGAKCKDRSFLFKVINVTDRYVVIETMQSGDVYSLTHHSFMSSCDPIETPAEKAQREEDEFIESVPKCAITNDYSYGYIEGLRAAYRKLKGGK